MILIWGCINNVDFLIFKRASKGFKIKHECISAATQQRTATEEDLSSPADFFGVFFNHLNIFRGEVCISALSCVSGSCLFSVSTRHQQRQQGGAGCVRPLRQDSKCVKTSLDSTMAVAQ